VPGGFIASAISDHLSRKLVLQIGVIITTLFTLLIPLVQSAEQLIVLRLLTGIGLGFAVTAPFPIAAELMPAQHRRTYSAIYEIMLASAFTLLPLIGLLLAHDPNGFRLIALPGGLALFVVPVVLQLVLPDSPEGAAASGSRSGQPDYPTGRRPGAAGHCNGARGKPANHARGASTLLGAFCSGSAALDCGWHRQRDLRRYRLLSDRGTLAKGVDRSRLRRDVELWGKHNRVPGDHPRQGI